MKAVLRWRGEIIRTFDAGETFSEMADAFLAMRKEDPQGWGSVELS